MDQIPEMVRRRREERRRERRQQITGVQVVFVSILAIGLLLTINFSARIRRGQVYTDLRNEVQGTLDALQQQNTDLRKQLDFAKSDAAVAQWAHQDGKMVRPGEVLIIPVPGYNAVPTPTPTRSSVIDEGGREPEVPVWQLWWSLFFDNDPP